VAAAAGVAAPQPAPATPVSVPAPPAPTGLDRAGAATLRLPEFRIEPGEKGSSYDIDHIAEKAPAAGAAAAAEAYEIAKESTRVGRFEIRALLGRGSFGKVYRAFDPLLGREVALKVFTGARDDSSALLQRRREARNVARLRHPNIVAVFEDGVDGHDYFIASELVKGPPMSTLMAEGIAPRRATVWVRELARALAYAHLEGLVHRDVKPSNILIDDRDRPQLVDFGLAYHVGEGTTASKTPVGTPAYMAPEQARGDPKAIGPKSDQYSLGVVFYELLTRRRPFEGEPQAILHQLQWGELTPPREVDPKINHDLEAICLKAMARKPADRYPDLANLAKDLGQWLAGEPVSARPLSRARSVAQFALRHARWIAAVSSVCAIAGIVAATVLYIALNNQKARTREESARLDAFVESARQRELENLFRANSNDKQLRDTLTEARRPLARLYHRNASLLAGRDDVLSTAHYLAAAIEHGRQVGDLAVYGPAREDLALLTARLLPGRPAVPVTKVTPATMIIDVPSRGVRLGLGEAESARLWARPLRPWPDDSRSDHRPHFVTALAIKAGGTAAVVVGEHSLPGIWTAAGRTFFEWYGHENTHPIAAAFAPDGKAVMLADGNRNLSLIQLDAGTRRENKVVLADRITTLAYAPDGSWVAASGPRKAIWRIEPGTMHHAVFFEHPVVPESLEFENEGKVLTTVGEDGVVRRWDATTGQAVGEPVVLAERVVGLATAPDGRVLRVLQSWTEGRQTARNSSSHLAQIFGPDGHPSGPPFELASEEDPTRTTTARRRLNEFGNALVCVALSNDGKTLLAVRRPERELGGLQAAGGGPFRLYDAITCREHGAEFSLRPGWSDLCLRPDGRLLLVEYTKQIDRNKYVANCRLFDTHTGRQVGQELIGTFLGFSADSRWLATTSATWELPTFPPMDRLLPHPEPVRFAAFEPDGRTLLTVSGTSTLRRWNRMTGEQLAQPVGPASQEVVLALSPDGRLLLTAQDKVARILEISSGKEIGAPMAHDSAVTRGAFATDGSAVVTNDGQTCRVWKVDTGQALGRPQTHAGRVEAVALGPRGALLYTAESVRESRGDQPSNYIWDTASGQPKCQMGPVADAIGAFSADGTRLFMGSPDHQGKGDLGVWDTSNGEPIATIGASHSDMGGVTVAAFSPDGRLLVVGFDRGQIMVYEAATGQVICPLDGRHGALRDTDEHPDEQVASHPANRAREGDPSPVTLAIDPEGRSVLIGLKNGIARMATLPAHLPQEGVRDWLATRTGANLNSQATVGFLYQEAWYERWKASAPTPAEPKESDAPAAPAPLDPG
jgi:WD40 repeat protein